MLLLVACGPSAAPPPVSGVQVAHGQALGTTWTVKWVGLADDRPAVATQDALALVDAAMSTWRDDSELSRIRATEGPAEVSESTYQVIAAALGLAAKTGGAFDPTVQPLVELWGFHGERRLTLPSEDELAAARAVVGYQKVQLQGDEGFWVDSGGTALDLSAIAKGHAVDEVSVALAGLGLANHMVEVGGEVRVSGSGPAGSGWRLGVDSPEDGLAPGEKLAAVVVLADRALATSGNYRNSYVIDGMDIGHTLDPRTGRPAQSGVLSATVVAADCQTADGWATALMVMGVHGLALVESEADVDALLLLKSTDGFTSRWSTGMSGYLTEE